MARLSPDQIGLRDAADIFGVSIDTLRRRIRDNQMDEALLVQGPFGATWVLPKEQLETIAVREQWELPAGEVSAEASSAVSRETGGVHTERVPVGMPAADGTVAGALQSAGAGAPAAPVEIAVSGNRSDQALAALALAPVIDLTDQSSASPTDAAEVPQAGAGLDEIAAVVAEEIARGLAHNVETELAAVRDAITAAEVRAVAAEARTDSLRSEKGRLEAQLKRAEADIEYWRSQHDRLDRDLDRERSARTGADEARSVAEAEVRLVREQVASLSYELSETQDRERVRIAAESALQSELDQATLAMGWWSRRRLAKLQARSSGRTPPPPVGD